MGVFRESVIPLLLYALLQVPVFFIGINIISDKDYLTGDGWVFVLKTHVIGQMLIWMLLQLMAVPLILCRVRFSALLYGFLIILIILCLLGAKRFVCLRKRKNLELKYTRESFSGITIVLLIVAVALILIQFFLYFLGQHIDQDDARWLAEANDALEYGDMMTRNVSTGEFLGWFDTIRDVTSPWAMFFAVLAKIIHTNTAVAAHTVYAPITLLMSYGIYYLIGRELFKKNESWSAFLLSVVVLNLFFAGTVYTQSVFTLVRIWQGKATVAGIFIPFLFYLGIRINKRNEKADWLCLAITGCAACLTSGMGISLSGILIILLGGYSIITYRRWGRIPFWILSLSPSVGFSLLYFYLKG